MGISKNRGTPKSSIFNRVFHYKPSILGYPYFWKHPYSLISPKTDKGFSRFSQPVKTGPAAGGVTNACQGTQRKGCAS